ncbi:MAG: DUF6915 family protein [Candidatus Bathyarchaeia archaeon]
MKPLIHAQSSAAKHGGTPEDYLPIHDYMDSTKSACADVRHRAVFHSAFGIFIVEKVFGTYITNSIGKKVSVRDIAEQHVQEDLGFIPSLEHWVKGMTIEPWMMGKKGGKSHFIPMEDITIDGNRPVTPYDPDVIVTSIDALKGKYYD